MSDSEPGIGLSLPAYRPIQRDESGGEEGLDAHIVETTADGAGETVPGLRLAVKTLRAPAVSLVEALVVVRPAFASAPG
jgi:hypothetical protein